MKLSKILMSGALVAALAFGVMGCKAEDDDDELKALSGSNNNYSVDFKNEGNDVYRAYHTTTFKHAGALCQVTMNTSNGGKGAMGYIWDLESNSTRAEKEPRRFFIVGFNYDYTATGKVAYYVSRYSNVTDIEANNFGAPSNGAVEKEYIKLNATNVCVPTIDANGDLTMTFDVYEDGEFTVDENGKKKYTSYNGGFVVDIYNGKIETADLKTANKVKSVKIPAADVGYKTAESDVTKPICGASANQKQGAVYVNVYQGNTLKGKWHYADTYKAAEVVED